jgi:DNA-binding HxlR family transcriptional regulator
MKTNEAAESEKQASAHVSRMVEDVLGCKWSMVVLGLVRKGTTRPGAIERSVPGLTTKVLNERLRKLVRFGVIQRQVFPETPPRVEYTLTAFGARFVKILAMIDELEAELSGSKPVGR